MTMNYETMMQCIRYHDAGEEIMKKKVLDVINDFLTAYQNVNYGPYERECNILTNLRTHIKDIKIP